MELNKDQPESKFGEGSPLPKPELILYQKTLDSKWDETRIHGIDNLGTNCFMNSVIQCLQYVPCWSNFLWNDHIGECLDDDCFACMLGAFTYISHFQKLKTQNPKQLCKILTSVSKDFKPWQQQDAHEFLICFFDSIQKTLAPKNVNSYVEMTTAVGKIFGGFLRSQIACQECLTTSNTYEPYFNISLDIENIITLKDAFDKFVEIDTLDNEPCYNCEKCQKKTRAAKRYNIETLPEVLIIQLKRYDLFGKKLDHHLKIQKYLDLEPYMSSSENCSKYRLYGAIEHLGRSLRGGHYISLISHPASDEFNWYFINDESVQNCLRNILHSIDAYMLFYIRCEEFNDDDTDEKLSDNSSDFVLSENETSPELSDNSSDSISLKDESSNDESKCGSDSSKDNRCPYNLDDADDEEYFVFGDDEEEEISRV